MKVQAKKRAQFVCVVCGHPFVEVHHIVPEADGGPNEIENAAPLCAGCHDLYGGNPEKRKTIRQMRDAWFEHCEKAPKHSAVCALSEQLDNMRSRLRQTELTQLKQDELLSEIKTALTSFHQSQAAHVSTAKSLAELSQATGILFPSGGEPCPSCHSRNTVLKAKFEGGASEGWECQACGAMFRTIVYDCY